MATMMMKYFFPSSVTTTTTTNKSYHDVDDNVENDIERQGFLFGSNNNNNNNNNNDVITTQQQQQQNNVKIYGAVLDGYYATNNNHKNKNDNDNHDDEEHTATSFSYSSNSSSDDDAGSNSHYYPIKTTPAPATIAATLSSPSSSSSPLIILLPNQQEQENIPSYTTGASTSTSTSSDASTSSYSSSSQQDFYSYLYTGADGDSSNASTTSTSSTKADHQKELSSRPQQEEEEVTPKIYHNYHDYDITKFSTEHTEWTVSEGTTATIDDAGYLVVFDSSEETNKQCCSFQGCGRGLRVPGWEAYNKSLDTNPVLTKACTSLCGWFLGDFVTQTVITRGPFDIRRSITLASFGFFFHGPVGHVVYDNLDALIVGTGPKEIAAKILFDQVLWCPIFMLCYFTYLGLANGDSPGMIVSKIHDDIFIAVLGSWKLWPVAHAIQFRYVATKHRIVYINCIEVCFIMFLSFLGNQ